MEGPLLGGLSEGDRAPDTLGICVPGVGVELPPEHISLSALLNSLLFILACG